MASTCNECGAEVIQVDTETVPNRLGVIREEVPTGRVFNRPCGHSGGFTQKIEEHRKVAVTIRFEIPGHVSLAELSDKLDTLGLEWELAGLGFA